MWQLQMCRADGGTEWEPISVEPVIRIDKPNQRGVAYERKFQYRTLDECKDAFLRFVEIEGSLPNLLMRMATGAPRVTSLYDVRAVFTSEPGHIFAADWKPSAHPEAPALPLQDQPTANEDELAAAFRVASEGLVTAKLLNQNLLMALRMIADDGIENRDPRTVIARDAIAKAEGR